MTHESIETLLDAARLAGLETTEGGRILAKVSRPDAKGTSYRSSLVEIDGDRQLPLTRGSASVGAVAAAEDGTTYFTAKRVGARLPSRRLRRADHRRPPPPHRARGALPGR